MASLLSPGPLHETVLPGAVLGSIGIQSPVLFPEQSVLIMLTRVDADSGRAI